MKGRGFMEEREVVSERRRHKRYKMLDVAAVVGDRRLGHILDMSEGGLSFSYIQMQADEDEKIDLGIIFGGNGLYLEKIPAEIICDSVLSHGPPYHPVVVRRRSMKFVDVTDEQRGKLTDFIKRHANGTI